MLVDIIVTTLGALMILAAFVGCIVPIVPGPILAALALVAISATGGWSVYSWPVLVGWGAAAIVVQILDNVLPARAAGRAGAGKGGIWGSVVGMIAGSVFFPPFGVFFGAFLGALAGEVIFHRENRAPLTSALAVFRGTIGAIILKLSVTGAIAFLFARGVIRLFGA